MKSGSNASPLKFQPPSSTDADKTIASKAPNIGNSAVTAEMPASHKKSIIE
jgi:hypothetical protein